MEKALHKSHEARASKESCSVGGLTIPHVMLGRSKVFG